MNGATKLALAVGLPVAVLIAAGQSAAAVTPPTEPPGTELGVSIPADFVPLTDDTGTITVMVPGSWTDVSTAQVGVIPTIEASTDREAYNATFDVAGVTYRAAPFREDTETAAREFGLSGGCVNEAIEPYDDGVFVGSHLIYTECGGEGSTAEFHVVAANPADQAFTALLRIQITGPDEQPILRRHPATFNAAPAGTTGSSVPASSSLPPVTTAARARAAGCVPAAHRRDPWPTGPSSSTTPRRSPSRCRARGRRPISRPPRTRTARRIRGSRRPPIRPVLPARGDDRHVQRPRRHLPGGPVRGRHGSASSRRRYTTSIARPIRCRPTTTACSSGTSSPFNDCGGTASRIVQVAANPADQAVHCPPADPAHRPAR